MTDDITPNFTPDPALWRCTFAPWAVAWLEKRDAEQEAAMKRLWLVTWREKHEQGSYDASLLVWCESQEDAIKMVQDGIDATPVPGCKWTAREYTAEDFDKSDRNGRPLEQWHILKVAREEFWGNASLEPEDFAAIRERWKEQREFAAHPKLLEV